MLRKEVVAMQCTFTQKCTRIVHICNTYTCKTNSTCFFLSFFAEILNWDIYWQHSLPHWTWAANKDDAWSCTHLCYSHLCWVCCCSSNLCSSGKLDALTVAYHDFDDFLKEKLHKIIKCALIVLQNSYCWFGIIVNAAMQSLYYIFISYKKLKNYMLWSFAILLSLIATKSMGF